MLGGGVISYPTPTPPNPTPQHYNPTCTLRHGHQEPTTHTCSRPAGVWRTRRPERQGAERRDKSLLMFLQSSQAPRPHPPPLKAAKPLPVSRTNGASKQNTIPPHCQSGSTRSQMCLNGALSSQDLKPAKSSPCWGAGYTASRSLWTSKIYKG